MTVMYGFAMDVHGLRLARPGAVVPDSNSFVLEQNARRDSLAYLTHRSLRVPGSGYVYGFSPGGTGMSRVNSTPG
jgi:hypothetical protein